MKKHWLWPRSILQYHFDFLRGVTRKMLLEEIAKKERLDDRTPDEDEFLQLMKDSLDL